MTGGFDAAWEFANAADRVAVLAHNVDLKRPVPTCPGWTAYDVLVHLGNVHAWAATIVETGQPADELNDEPDHRRNKSVADWYLGKAEDLIGTFKASDPGNPCWNFAFGEGHASFWPRRQLHETLIHELDLIVGTRRRIPRISPEIAADGIDEALTVFLHRMHSRGYPADLTEPLTFVCEDIDRAWTVVPDGGTIPTVHEGSAPDVDHVLGPAQALHGLLWKRVPPTDSSIRFAGDHDRIRRFLASRLTA